MNESDPGMALRHRMVRDALRQDRQDEEDRLDRQHLILRYPRLARMISALVARGWGAEDIAVHLHVGCSYVRPFMIDKS